MIRGLLLGIAAVGLPGVGASAPAAQAVRDWSKTISATPEGGFRIGNPAAPAKLIEYGSLTCSHCATFHLAAMPELKRGPIASGRLSYEFRNFVLNGPDMAASLLARCQGPAAFFGHADYFFGQQRQWLEPFAAVSAAERERLSKLPPDQMLHGFVSAAGLEHRMAARGMPAAKVRQCLSDKVQTEQLVTIRATAMEQLNVQGTPTFVLNGKTLAGVHDWTALKPLLGPPGG